MTARGERSPVIRGRDAVWAEIRGRGVFALHELMHASGLHKRSVQQYVLALEAGGYVQRKPGPVGRGMPVRWRLVRDVGTERPRLSPSGRPLVLGQGAERMWRALWILKQFNVDALLAVVNVPAMPPVSRAYAKRYLMALHRAGYVRAPRPGTPGTPTVYAAVSARRSGPRPPKILRGHQVYDANLACVVWPPAAAQHQAVRA